MRYKHDCQECKPLGEFQNYDLYFCRQGGDFPTVIARYGNDGQDYTSGLGLFTEHQGLVEAQRRATEQGYIKAEA